MLILRIFVLVVDCEIPRDLTLCYINIFRHYIRKRGMYFNSQTLRCYFQIGYTLSSQNKYHDVGLLTAWPEQGALQGYH